MALNSSGPIGLGGTAVGRSIELELGMSGTSTISMNDAVVRTLLGVPSGTISLSAAYGKSNAPIIPPANGGYVGSANFTSTTLTGGDATTKNWTVLPPKAIAYGNGTFVVPGYYNLDGNYLPRADCMTSTDGVNWVSQAVNFAAAVAPLYVSTVQILDVVWTGMVFFAVGTMNAGVSSPDGANWTRNAQITSLATGWAGASGRYNSITSNGGGRLVAVGLGGVNAYSNDHGATWAMSTDALISGYSWLSVCWTGTKFVAVGKGRCGWSTDGITWTQSTNFNTLVGGSSSLPNSVCWTGTKLIVVGADSTGAVLCATSPDGVTWTKQAGLGTAIGSGATTVPQKVLWTGTYAISVGMGGKYATSPDGITWTNQAAYTTTVGSGNVIYGIVQSQSKLVIVGGNTPSSFAIRIG